jgi:hypothetical protein
MAPRKDLGSILVDENVIGPKDLERVERERGARPLWAALVDAELTTEDEIFFVMAKRFGVAVLAEETIVEAKMPESLKRALGREHALNAGLFPIELAPDGRRVTVAMVDPSDERELAALLTKAQVPEGRAVLGRRSAIERAIERTFAPRGAQAPAPPPTGSVQIDPALAAEIQRLPARVLKSDPLTPVPRLRRRKTSPQGAPAAAPEAPEAPGDLLRAEERLSQALVQAVEALAVELENRVHGLSSEGSRAGRPGLAQEMARLSRRVARQLGLGRRASEEIGVAAQLYAIDRLLRAVDGEQAPGSSGRFGELGWPGSAEGGLVPVLRSLTAAAAGFGRGAAATPPLGARIVGLVADYLELGAAGGENDLGTVSQLLRASSAGAPVVDALLRVLEVERADATPETKLTTLPAHSVLREEPDATPTESEKTVKKMAPVAPSGRTRREPPQE